MSHLRRAVLVLVACALLAAPTPEAVAQQPPRSQPRELWQQFPLEEKRSSSRAPAELESTPEVSAPTTRGTPGEQTGESGRTVRTAVIVLAMALVLMLTTGVLAYAAHGELAFWAWGRRRRIAHSFLDILERPPVEAPPQRETERLERQESNAKPMVRNPGRPRRHAKREAAVTVASITSEVDALRKKLDVGTAPKKTESPGRDRIERLREKFDMYFASAKTPGTQDDKVDSLKAKLDVTRPPAKSESVPDDERQRLKKKLAMRPADSGSASHDEHERLKEKLSLQPADAESASHDELQTLKEKLRQQPSPPKSVSTTHEELETLKAKFARQASLATAERETADAVASKEKLNGSGDASKRETTVRTSFGTQPFDHGPRPMSEVKVDVHADTPTPKLDVGNRPARDRSQASVAVDVLDPSLRELRGERLAAATPVARRPVRAATLRSTISQLVHVHSSDLAALAIGLVLAMLALLLLHVAVAP
jgi:hypothetical protein